MKSFAIAILLLLLTSCAIGVGGVQRYIDAVDGYQFLYPNGWQQVSTKGAKKGVDVLFEDLIERGENLSVVVSSVAKGNQLSDLGTPTEIGQRFLQSLNLDPEVKREAELINAESHDNQGKIYYTIEYQVKLPNQPERHNLSSIAVSRDKLYTFNLSAHQERWAKVKDLFNTVASSFSVD